MCMFSVHETLFVPCRELIRKNHNSCLFFSVSEQLVTGSIRRNVFFSSLTEVGNIHVWQLLFYDIILSEDIFFSFCQGERNLYKTFKSLFGSTYHFCILYCQDHPRGWALIDEKASTH